MKKYLLLILMATSSVIAFAQSEKYTAAMKKNIALIDSAFRNTDAFLGLANNFERIGVAEKNQWLPFYYAAYCRVNYGLTQKDQSGGDPIADKATELINVADSLQPDNSEVSVIRSMIATMKMTVNPQQRFMQYGPVISAALQKAQAQDPANPRPYLIRGQNLKYTPEQFGGGCKKALAELETASAKFSTFTASSEISPNWGKEYTEMLIKECR